MSLPKNQTILFNTMVLTTMWTFKFNFSQIIKIGHIWVCQCTIDFLYYFSNFEKFFQHQNFFHYFSKFEKFLRLKITYTIFLTFKIFLVYQFSCIIFSTLKNFSDTKLFVLFSNFENFLSHQISCIIFPILKSFPYTKFLIHHWFLNKLIFLFFFVVTFFVMFTGTSVLQF